MSTNCLCYVLGFAFQVVKETWGRSGRHILDYTVYTGALGTAYLLFKAYQITNNKDDLYLCSEIIKACDPVSRNSRQVTFICGRGGVYALGAVVAKHSGDVGLCDQYLTKFKEINLPKDLPNELLYGGAGFLWARSFLNKNLGRDTISSNRTRLVVDEIINSGRRLANKGRCPLMYEWHGKKYWGAAHGLAGIMHVLMDMELKPDEVEDVKGTLRFMIRETVSLVETIPRVMEVNQTVLCIGAMVLLGLLLLLSKQPREFPFDRKKGKLCQEKSLEILPILLTMMIPYCQVFGDEEFLKAAIDAGEVVWNRGLLKRVGLCHGISGNTYVFLALYRLTGKVEFLYRAKAFACFLHDKSQRLISEGVMHGGDRPFSLFEGIGGMAYVFLDMTEPSEARFPGYEL
ncbi:hypothetical protein RHMOL_Rhmol04G0035700 [Rhododendron molle]|uniref:Uncharacterized protein n=1 Tax=Rhododendron molle TaxID=49168 RepID=A0ACC0NX28_RHOML|nr:hypothetical protein RHMOL_Rhmol04G0035700 [Rhododendron molle]